MHIAADFLKNGIKVNDATDTAVSNKKVTAPRRRTNIDESTLDDKVAFDLGWDAYAGGLGLSGWRKYYKSVQKGWVAAQAKKVARSNDVNRYVRKVLKLRLGAWLRNRQFNLSVDENFLRAIDVEYCPVTLEKLTHGTTQPTDWSVDRINNRGGYSVSNLAIMSSRANVAKATYSYNRIHGFAHNPEVKIPEELYQDDGTPLTPLTRTEWARLAVICSHGPSSQDEDGTLVLPRRVVPCVIAPPPCVIGSVPNMLQMAISYKANSSKTNGVSSAFSKKMQNFTDSLIKGLSAAHKKDFNKLVSRAKKVSYNLNDPLSMWFNHALFLHFLEFFNGVTEDERSLMYNSVSKGQFLSKMQLDKLDRLNIENKGYISHQ
jgi:hypothetical protein